MFAVACFLLLAAQNREAAPNPDAGNRVEFCSLALGDCQSFAAADRDPSRRPAVPAGGQLAFIDPVTGARVTPTEEQAGELQLRVEEEQKSAGLEPTFAALPGGGTRARLHGAYTLYLKATLEPKPVADKEQPR
jgi:hypothetical protein